MEPIIDVLKILQTSSKKPELNPIDELQDLKAKTIIIDGTNKHPKEYLNWDWKKVQDLKYSLTVPNLEDKYEIYIVNPTIFEKIKYLNHFEPRNIPAVKIQQKIQNISSGDCSLGTFELFDYVRKNLENEKDIVIYCEDPDELEHTRSAFMNQKDTQVIVLVKNSYFEPLWNLVYKP